MKAFYFEIGVLGPEQVDVKVINCGICHSDLRMINNDWGMSTYPIVPVTKSSEKSSLPETW